MRLNTDCKATTKRLMVMVCALALAGCSSVGLQYVQPAEGEPAAELVVEPDMRDLTGQLISNTTLKIVNTRETDGCYVGYTGLDYEDKIRMRPGKQVLISVRKNYRNQRFCNEMHAFTPEPDARYSLSSTHLERCELTIKKIVNEKPEFVRMENPRRIKPGVRCP